MYGGARLKSQLSTRDVAKIVAGSPVIITDGAPLVIVVNFQPPRGDLVAIHNPQLALLWDLVSETYVGLMAASVGTDILSVRWHDNGIARKSWTIPATAQSIAASIWLGSSAETIPLGSVRRPHQHCRISVRRRYIMVAPRIDQFHAQITLTKRAVTALAVGEGRR